MFAPSRRAQSLALASLGWLLMPVQAQADPTGHFELRLGASEPDAVLELGNPADDTVELELWVEITGVAPDALVQAFSVYLQTSADNVVSFDGVLSDCPFPLVFAQGTDNEPFSGDFSRAGLTTVTGVSAGIGAPALYGRFTISALATGSVSYTFSDTGGAVRPWQIKIKDLPEITGGQLSFSIDPRIASIVVIPSNVSADADEDGDVDLADYAALLRCVDPGGALPGGTCASRDLNGDGRVDRDDISVFVSALTGPMPEQGDLDADGDVDLRDYSRMQACFCCGASPAKEEVCRFADINGDDETGMADVYLLLDHLSGPSRDGEIRGRAVH